MNKIDREDLFHYWIEQFEDIRYRGFQIKYVICMPLLQMVVKKIVGFGFIALFFRAFDIKKQLKQLELNQRALLFSMGEYGVRKDYREILDFVRASTTESSLFDFSKANLKWSFSIRRILWSLRTAFCIKKMTIKESLYIAAHICFYASVMDDLKRIDLSPKKYCAFSSVHPLEAIFVEYFKQRNIPTYSLQHGIYYIFKNTFIADSLAYKNFNADYHLCWGQYSKDEFVAYGIDSSKLVIAGYPRKIETVVKSVWDRKKCVVLLSRVIYHKENINLLVLLSQLANEKGVKFSLKLHPSLDFELYAELARKHGFDIVDKSVTMTELFKNNDYGWAISVNTSTYYEAYMSGLPTLRYTPVGAFDDPTSVYDNDFCTYEQLCKSYHEIPFDTMAIYLNEADDILCHIVGMGENSYGEILKV